MTEVLFYHLTEQNLFQTLPGLLERSLEREWRVVVQCGSEGVRDNLDAHLWSYRDDSFLPHGTEKSLPNSPDVYPIWLTTNMENENKAHIRFLVDGAVPDSVEDYQRAIYMFDGFDEFAVAEARTRWKIEKAAGHELTYWQQKEGGGWVKKA